MKLGKLAITLAVGSAIITGLLVMQSLKEAKEKKPNQIEKMKPKLSMSEEDVIKIYSKELINTKYNEKKAKEAFNKTFPGKETEIIRFAAQHRMTLGAFVSSQFKESSEAYSVQESPPEGVRVYVKDPEYAKKNAFYMITYTNKMDDSEEVKKEIERIMVMTGDALETKPLISYYEKNFYNMAESLMPYGAALLRANPNSMKNHNIDVKKIHEIDQKLKKDDKGYYIKAFAYPQLPELNADMDINDIPEVKKEYVEKYKIILSESDIKRSAQYIEENKDMIKYPMFRKLTAIKGYNKNVSIYQFVADSHTRETDVNKVLSNLKGETSSMVGMLGVR